MLRDVQTLKIALAQIAPRLGALEVNLATHHELLEQARKAGADLVVFPELGLTGYQLQDLASEVAMRLDDPRLAELAGATRGLSAVVSFVEESADHRLFIAAALLEDGEIRHVHRKLFLPTYGLFDERRFFAAGDVLRAVPSRLGVGLGIGICEDFWHLSVPQLLALDGAQILINVSSSPGRDLAATNEVGLGTATSWRTLMRTYAQLTTSFVIFCNRVGVDESISFWGGSEVIAPTGQAVFSAPLYDEGLFTVDVAPADIRRERIALPLLRDERLELQVRELGRIVAERAGLASDTNAEPGAEPGFDLLPAEEPSLPIGFGTHGERPARPGGPRRMTTTESASDPGAPFDLPSELAIDTDVARRVIAEFIRGQLEQAGFERAVVGLSGGIDSAVVAYLVAEAIGAERLLAVLMPYRTSSPASRADAESVVAALGCASELVEISAMVDGYFGTGSTPGAAGPDGLTASPVAPRELRRADADGRPVRPVGDVGRARGRHRQQDGDAHRLHDDLRRRGLRVQPDRRPVQEPGPPAGGRPGRPRRDRPQGAVGRPVARPDRRDRGRLQLSGPRPAPLLAGRQAAFDRGDGRARVRSGDGRAGRPDGRRRRVQAPGAADRQARAADGGRGLPLSAAATGVGARVTAADPKRGAGAGAGPGRGGADGSPRARRGEPCTSSRRRSATWAT